MKIYNTEWHEQNMFKTIIFYSFEVSASEQDGEMKLMHAAVQHFRPNGE